MPAPDVAALLSELERSEPVAAEHARTAVDWLTGGEPLETITELTVCEFLWYTLPTKISGDRPAIARALGRLLMLGGLHRYAARCSSSTTSHILRAYARHGEDAGMAAYQSALDTTGVLPPDVPELRWSSIMGPEELGAHGACSAALELAIVSGELTPRSPARQDLTRRWLTEPRAELGGDNWLQRVQGERLNRWVLGRGTPWRELAQPFEVRLHAPVPAPGGTHLEVLRWLLEAGCRTGGVPLTQRHNFARSVLAESPWSAEELTAVREVAEGQMDALRRAGRRLVTTPAGQRLLGDPDLLWEAMSTALLAPAPGESGLRASAREVALMLLADGAAADRDRITAVIDCAEWQTFEIDASLAELGRRLDAFGLRAGGRLTPAGRSAVLAALRSHALRPRQYVNPT
ncbi:hypothetical protein FHS43_006838 [Streptosporangium becharense]|uniref:Uncharacterized protein n=1 Tax=Streptosporangium becharense TaxID=1816182 RepID=A0A7W9MHD3_9ACTN|nr:hypothetical protein [Streptosporangium becharense]MBB2915517.1 hypothetical protein [Streptosporangium becharense]MBB5821022.1 hypothetical protein [Streptosporangium becharense]